MRATSRTAREATIERLDVNAFTVPTDRPESDGTIAWDSTTIVVVHATADGTSGVGYAYAHASAASVVADVLASVVAGRAATDVPASWLAMQEAVRNLGRPGIAAGAIAAVDVALWDLKARLLDLPLVSLLGAVRPAIAAYGSGGFTSYSIDALQEQFARWTTAGLTRVKMKVGRHEQADQARVRAAREAIGRETELFVDANGAWTPARAIAMADAFAPYDVCWFEEPVSSDDLDGLARVRDRTPVGMEIAAGEYGYDAVYFARMLGAGAVDVLQADATRCAGVTGFLQAAALCDASAAPLSAHTAPALHATLCCSAIRARHVEYFHDHVRIEQLLFDGGPVLRDGALAPDTSRPGLGLDLKRADAAPFQVA